MKAEVDKKVAFSDQQKKANILFRVIVEQGPNQSLTGFYVYEEDCAKR